ncbi:hypothetical protein ACWGRF_01950 [Streptomyces zhihengii]
MNRSKHPDRPFRRSKTATDTTRNHRRYRVEAAWLSYPDTPSSFSTQDEAQANRRADQWADRGAYVIVEWHPGDLRWRTLYELDGPARVTARREAAQARHEAAQRARDAARTAQDTRTRAERREAALARIERVMVMPPVPREATGRTTARHTAGGGR